MIYKKRSVPKNLLGLTAFLHRLHPEHEKLKKIQDTLASVKAGFGGEEHFDKQLFEFKPSYPHAILHDVCLQYDGVYFQMDSILITPSFIIIFEVKNIAGKLIFLENPTRFVRQLSTGETTAMQSPIAQLERKRHFLREWLLRKGIRVPVPIKGIVAFAYAKEIQPVSVPDIHITFAYQVPTYLYNLPMKKQLLASRLIFDLALELKRSHEEYDPFPLRKRWDIMCSDLLPGVICHQCKFRGMKWERRKWICPRCKNRGSENHLAAIADWFYLVDKKMTNRDFREFLLVDNNHVAKRLLAKSQLYLKGERKGSYYVMNK